jgi:hypothetical protein
MIDRQAVPSSQSPKAWRVPDAAGKEAAARHRISATHNTYVAANYTGDNFSAGL